MLTAYFVRLRPLLVAYRQAYMRRVLVAYRQAYMRRGAHVGLSLVPTGQSAYSRRVRCAPIASHRTLGPSSSTVTLQALRAKGRR